MIRGLMPYGPERFAKPGARMSRMIRAKLNAQPPRTALMVRSYFAGIQLRQAPDWGGEANAGILLLVSRMGHQGAGDAAVVEVANQEAAARKSQRDAKTSIEECDEPRGGNARRT